MSLFRSTGSSCPMQRRRSRSRAVHSVNADRRPDLRQEILEAPSRPDAAPPARRAFASPELQPPTTCARGQVVAAGAGERPGHWQARETAAARAVLTARTAPRRGAGARGRRRMKPRSNFGWPALREKLVVRRAWLDDVAVEGCKCGGDDAPSTDLPLSPARRLAPVSPSIRAAVVLDWVKPADNAWARLLRCARTLHDEDRARRGRGLVRLQERLRGVAHRRPEPDPR